MIKIREKEFDLFFENKVQKVALLTKHVQTYQEIRKFQSNTSRKHYEYHLNIKYTHDEFIMFNYLDSLNETNQKNVIHEF